MLIPFAFCLWNLPLPSVSSMCFGSLAVVFAVILCYSIQYTTGLLVFWMKDGTYTRMITDSLFTLFSGLSIPLWFYPQWLEKFCGYLPFRLTVYEPVCIWLGRYTHAECIRLLILELIWILAVTVLEKWLWNRIGTVLEIEEDEKMGVYGAFLKNGFLTQMAHRGQYAMRMLAKIMGWSTGMIMVLILLERFRTDRGWNREEILLLYAFDILSYSVAATFFMGSFGKLHRLIRQENWILC